MVGRTVDAGKLTVGGRSLPSVLAELMNKVKSLEGQIAKVKKVKIKPSPISAASIPFKSGRRFKADNIQSAIEECKAFLLGQLSADQLLYNKKKTIGDMIRMLRDNHAYSFNEGMLELIPEMYRPDQVDNVKDALDQIVRVFARLSNEE